MSRNHAIPVIDLFAGPGGLGEGFSAPVRGSGHPFRIKLSIEKDVAAHQTLELRSFFRQFDSGAVPDDYYRMLRGEIDRAALFAAHECEADAAKKEAWRAELGVTPASSVRSRISDVLRDADPWVLLGGPPCQAYSLAGRSRNSGRKDYDPATDKRQTLYVEYLQTLADHWPAVFVMENVKGLLSATVNEKGIFTRILEDLREPKKALTREDRTMRRNGRSHTYELYSLVQHGLMGDVDLTDFVVHSEDFGIPQCRHRVIILGIRNDMNGTTPDVLPATSSINASRVLDGLPRLRSGLSKESDSSEDWINVLQRARASTWLRLLDNRAQKSEILDVLDGLSHPRHGRGGEFVECNASVGYEETWFLDSKIHGACNHASRGHMSSDLHRYLFASTYAKVCGRSPVLSDFPVTLQPNHANVKNALVGGHFEDRFRVQLRNRPSTTITSHISKDGHYYIHPDPTQCRSLTVREAARLQTFPDNYFFCGNRTSQYTQVGNAVPPLLARAIAKVVYSLLR